MKIQKLQQIEICTFSKWILVRLSDTKTKEKDLSSIIHFFDSEQEEFDFMIDFPFAINRIEVDSITNEIYLSIE